MFQDGSLPSYEELFGDLDFRTSDESRSVYSPAAYLADLLQLLDNGATTSALAERRPGIRDVPLDAENTYTELPYLDIVNEVLEKEVRDNAGGADAYQFLSTLRFPFSMPFSLRHEQLRRYLHYLGVDPVELYRQFAPQVDPDTVAREYLGLSPEDVRVLTTVLTDGPELRSCYQLSPEEPFTSLEVVEEFRRATMLTASELCELLFGNLSVTPVGDAQPECVVASGFFIHRGSLVILDPDDRTLVRCDRSAPVPVEWFERVNRFTRLARRIGMSFTDLDLVLTRCCLGQIDLAALRTIAVLTYLQRSYEFPIDVVCSLVAPINTWGIGNEDAPQDLFNRIFNTPFAAAERSVIRASEYSPPGYAGLPELTTSGDILATRNKEYRRRVAAALGLTENDIIAIVTRFRQRYSSSEPSPFDRGEIGLAVLSLLHRISRLTTALAISLDELFGVLDALESDPSIQPNTLFNRYTSFPRLIDPGPPQTQDCYAMLDAYDVSSSLWLMQVLPAAVRWMRASGFSAQELIGVIGGTAARAAELAGSADGQGGILDSLRQQFETVVLASELFVSARFSERAAQVIHAVMTTDVNGVVSALDNRLLRVDPTLAASTAYTALAWLPVIMHEDFLQLGLDERFTAKIFANLVVAGYLEPSGALVESRLPQSPADLRLSGEFGPHRDALFALINGLVPSSATRGELTEDAPPDPAWFFPSDLANLDDLSAADQVELYDNLVFHGYLDAEGNILAPDFFAQPDNVEAFVVNADLGDVAPAVLTRLHDQVERFRTDRLALDPAIFAALPFSAAQLADLVESLRFNGYIDRDNVYLDKAAVLDLALADLALALEFYPHRRSILDAMQAQLAGAKAEFCTFIPEDFRDIADKLVAQLVTDRLEGTYTDDSRVPEDGRAFFADPSHELTLAGFTASENATIFHRISTILAEQQPYQLDLAALTDLGFSTDERARLVALLIEAGHLTEGLTVPEDKLGYFGTVHNALDFVLAGLQDYSKDIFFLLHAVAMELTAGITEIVTALAARENAQLATLFTVLQDGFGIPAATVEVICSAIAGSAANVLDLLVAPALATDAAGSAADPRASRAYRQIRSFALLAAKLGLDATEVGAAFHDQDLVGKFPEPLALPPEVDRIDALLDSADGNVYLFREQSCWVYSRATYALTEKQTLGDLSSRFAGLARVDAAFTDASGTEWVIGRDSTGVSHAFIKAHGSSRWIPKEQAWGVVENDFADPARIDAAFVDDEGRTYLFCGEQYVRYSTPDYTHVDEGYPRTIGEWWEGEDRSTRLPAQFRESIDAAFYGHDDTTHLFAKNRCLAVADGATDKPIAEVWGKVRNTFTEANRVDAACTTDAGQFLFCGDQMIRYSDCIENDGVRVDDGHPVRIESHFSGLPVEFEADVEAAFVDGAGVTHLFKDGKTVALRADGASVEPTARRWGLLGPVLPISTVDAAFVGLDGRTYLFSGDYYLRYSGAGYAVVDAGYPRRIAGDWGGLTQVDASFVLDGATYLFGTGGRLFDLSLVHEYSLNIGHLPREVRQQFLDHGITVAEEAPVTGQSPEWHVSAEGQIQLTLRRDGEQIQVHCDPATAARFYVRYSTRNYTAPDPGYPKPLLDNWWNLPAGLGADEGAFAEVDAVFTGRDNRTYLFSGDQFVVFDNKRRWWSEPQSLRQRWDSIPFGRVDAAFVGRDGKTYVFSGQRYLRYSGADYTRIDDRYPAPISPFWGNVVNNIARTGKVDAALVLDAPETVDGGEAAATFTYLFSGNQYVRYTGTDYARVDDGYPKSLASLATEPRLGNLDVPLDGGVDAAFADRRTVYLFTGQQWHAVSDALYRRYDHAGAGCAFVEDGAVLVENADGWHRYSALEGKTVTASAVRPRTLRTVPVKFRTGLDAVLQGVDGNTYLFQGTSCFNTQLNREYPLAEEWGHPRNTIYDDNTVDAAFTGADGKTYVFSGDQFVVYPGTTYLDAEIEGEPRSIAAHWGGLTSVALAYVRNGTTYVFEQPDPAGALRYLVYSGEDYAQPDDGYPQSTDSSFWAVPENYRPAGFTAPDAVLFEGETMLLLTGEQYLQYNGTTQTWSYPRPLDRIWPGLGPAEGLSSAFTGRDGATYFFFDDKFTRYDGQSFSDRAPIRQQWGRMRNNFVATNEGSKVDAAFVYRGEVTFLFSGDQYVRYTGADYRYVDAGYPKLIAGNLRTEEAFTHLPESFEDALAERIASGTGTMIDAVVANHRNLYLFVGTACHVVSQSLTASYDLSLLGRVRNTIADRQQVDAALVTDASTYLFAGDQYVRYSGSDYAFVDDGYPRTIAASLPDEPGIATLPEQFQDGIDAAFRGTDARTYLFAGRQYLQVDGETSTTAPVKDGWGRVRNEFLAECAGIDAAFVAPSGELYVFTRDQYARYRPGKLDIVEEGYPRLIKDQWGNLPPAFEEDLDGAFVFEGRTYLCKDEEYVRYSGQRYDTVDRTYPQSFRQRWSDSADYRLNDVYVITRFVELARAHPSDDGGLAAFLVPGPVTVGDPYRYLWELFGWDIDELKWCKRHSRFLSDGPEDEDRFELEFLLELADLFALTGKLGAGPSQVFTDIWRKIYAEDPLDADFDEANKVLYGLLARRHTAADWPVLSRQLHDELNVLKRDALVPAVIAQTFGKTPELRTSRDLFERFLIDVDMGSRGTTSRVREAIAATQLYLQRYLLNLEAGENDGEVRARVKRWWTWMRNYRTWEANRKVFLYPENYLRPELRAAKTPAFEALESDLLQGEITPETVQRAYKRYLDEYTEVSRLTIAGGYVYHQDQAPTYPQRLVLFGRTRTDPRRYYYRQAEFGSAETLSGRWEPWLKVDLQIDADQVYPVYAFARVFVFWATTATVAADDEPMTTTIVPQKDDDGQRVSAKAKTQQVKIYYSFYNLNKEWMPAQILGTGAKADGTIGEVSLFVQADAGSGQESGDTHESIIVVCSYPVTPATTKSSASSENPPEPVRVAFTLNPELYAQASELTQAQLQSVAAAVTDATDQVTKIFVDQVSTDPAQHSIVRLGSPSASEYGPWFSVDHKGGSFLCRPVAVPDTEKASRTPLKGNQDQLPGLERIDAAVELPNGTRYFFGNRRKQYVAVPEEENQGTGKSIASRWGKPRTVLPKPGNVDAVFSRGNHIFVFFGEWYVRFTLPDEPDVPLTDTPFRVIDPYYPKKIAGNGESLPNWTRVGAAFTGWDGVEYFFTEQGDHFAMSGSLSELRPISEHWAGRFGQVHATLVTDTYTYIIFLGGQYIRYSKDVDGTYVKDDDGKPLPDPDHLLKIEGNTAIFPEGVQFDAAFWWNKISYFFDNKAGMYHESTAKGTRRPPRQISVSSAIVQSSTVDAGWIAGDRLYLTRGTEYVRYTLSGGYPPDVIDDGYPQDLPRRIDTAFTRGDHVYLFSDNEYARVGVDQEPATATGFMPVAGAWGELPGTTAPPFDAALDSRPWLYLFLGSDYVRHSKTISILRPYERTLRPFEIIRLTTSTAYKLNQKLLSGGVPALLDIETQEIDELPAFSTTTSSETTIRVSDKKEVVDDTRLPTSSYLDFRSANGIYYWEIFFHAPLLIAQALNNAQRFEDAKQWYEYIFDPTNLDTYWRFLPFLTVDPQALADSCRSDLNQLKGLKLTVTAVEKLLKPVLDALGILAPAFQQNRQVDPEKQDERDALDIIGSSEVHANIEDKLRTLASRPKLTPAQRSALDGLQERAAVIADLRKQYDLLCDRDSLLRAYQEDPFDPHAIAELRPVAYRRAVVMGYIDNLLDWGDMLFRQYTGESIDEARMLYVLAYDLLGARPENLGTQLVSKAQSYADLLGHVTSNGALLQGDGAVHGSVGSAYFHIPENSAFDDYWVRVEDRLRKIRQSLNILGISQPLPLFEPPVDPMALVRSVASGAAVDPVPADSAVAVPRYRFAFLFRKAQELVDKLRQFGNDLLSVLERRDAEELSLLESRQEGVILAMTRSIKEAQVRIAEANLSELIASQAAASERAAHYERLIADGLSAQEKAQIDVMTSAANAHIAASVLKVVAGIAYIAPQIKVGPFIIGAETGGRQVGDTLDKAAEFSESLGEGLSMLGEMLGVRAEHERRNQDWELQLKTAQSDVVQIGHQLTSATQQLTLAQREADVLAQEITHNESVAAFLKDKFTNAELYGWMSGRLSTLYFQAYHMAYEMAKSAELAFRFERGVSDGEVSFIRPLYWESQRNGLLAGESLGLDLDRLGKAYLDTDSCSLEITKQVWLRELDPVALLRLRAGGSCEFALTEALFDYDFPGHFRRQIRTVTVTFLDAEGQLLELNATLTQLGHKTVLEADPKAVKYLLDPKGLAPGSLRSDWRPSQQIALSQVGTYRENNGLFELRFDDDRYLPFEGTGAVSTWRLERSGRATADPYDVVLTVKYTADHGGEIFAKAVKGMLKPYPAARFFDLAREFPEQWQGFLGNSSQQLVLPFTPDLFPGMSNRQISSIYSKYELTGGSATHFVLNGDTKLALDDGKLLPTPGLRISSNGSPGWTFTVDGDKNALRNVGLVLTYQASVG